MKRSNKKGFTLVELLVVIAIIAILAAVAVPTAMGIVKKGHQSNYESLRDSIANNIKLAAQGANGGTIEVGDVFADGNSLTLDKENEYIETVEAYCDGTDIYIKFTPKEEKFSPKPADTLVVFHNIKVTFTDSAVANSTTIKMKADGDPSLSFVKDAGREINKVDVNSPENPFSKTAASN